MPDQGVTDRENPAALSKHNESPGGGLAEGRKTLIERGQPNGCGGAVSLRKCRERRFELLDQAESRREVAKVDDVGPDRQCRDELRPLQRLGLARQSREA